MGTWGVGITSNDDFEDIKGQFFDCYYYDTMPISEIENSIISASSESITESDGGELHNVYFAIAWCEWKCGCLSERILNKVEQIITSGKDIEYWKELEATPQLCTQREKELNKFLARIKVANAKPIRRKHKNRFIIPLKTGDVFAYYSKPNGYYGCGVALGTYDSKLKPWEEEYNFYALFAVSELTSAQLPTTDQVLNAPVKDMFWNGGCTGYYLPKRGVKVIGNVADMIRADYREFRGDYFRGVKCPLAAYLRLNGRPSFDELISLDRKQAIDTPFPFEKPMKFLFDEANLTKPNTE